MAGRAKENVTLLNISEMIDLAIGTPEVGVVDFCMLQTVLHCLAQQLRVLGKNVELRGAVPTIPRENSQTISVTEFAVDTDKDTGNVTSAAKEPSPDTILVVERKQKTEPVEQWRKSETVEQRRKSETGQRMLTTQSPSTEKLSLVTMSKFNVLESTVDDLRNRVYGSMPKNEDILEEVRSQTNLKAITDMWTSLNVSSRLEAAEEGISKLSSLVQDLISGTAGLQDSLSRGAAIGPPAAAPVAAIAAAPATAQDAPEDATTGASTGYDLNKIQEDMNRIRFDLDSLTNSFKSMEPRGTAADGRFPDLASQMERLNNLEKRMKECCEDLFKKDGLTQDQLNSFQDQLEHLAKQMALNNANKLSPSILENLQGLMDLFKTVQDMQEQLKHIQETAMQLAAEKEGRQYHMNSLLEQIELLKTIKLDREDMVEAMANKADLRLVARKVSHDQFEIACDDLSKGLDRALGKLNMQESLWQQALDDIQREIESKLDKLELTPVKEFFNNKLKQLQENLKQMI
ncbi:unnamed protein product [Leptidea sinapis]|uniref:DUF4795 domain-containing protein n=1 Tax=Leptidea sinapis TaxID=189913 RepID=A0A5E4PSB6_9NEOP|nr:unnamed protein product [Leptidea sinapis]